MQKATVLRVIAVLAFVGALLLLAIWKSGLTGQICEKGAERHNEHCVTYNLAFVILSKVREVIDDNDGLITALATIIIAGFTAALWQSTDKLWQAGERQIKAAEDALNATRASSERQLRAYVLAADGGMEFPLNNDPIAHVVIKNFGQTPAYNVRSWIHIWVEEFPLPPDALPGPPPEGFLMSQNVMGPGFHTEFIHKRGNPLNLISVKEINDETAAIYVYGATKYLDCFGVERESKYLRFFRGKFTLGDTKLMSSYFEGNEAT